MSNVFKKKALLKSLHNLNIPVVDIVYCNVEHSRSEHVFFKIQYECFFVYKEMIIIPHIPKSFNEISSDINHFLHGLTVKKTDDTLIYDYLVNMTIGKLAFMGCFTQFNNNSISNFAWDITEKNNCLNDALFEFDNSDLSVIAAETKASNA